MAAQAIPKVQRAAIVTGFGGPEKLWEFLSLITDKPVPQPQAGQVRCYESRLPRLRCP